MMDKVKEWTEQLKDRWQMQSSLKKMIVVLSVISVLGITAAVYYLNTRIEYGILFTDLSDADAGTISKDLEEQQIAYKLADNGTTILIDKDQVDEYRINLAVDNKLPNTSTGFELFDDANMMTTDEDRKIMYQRAVTGELQRAIESIDAVKSAKVLLRDARRKCLSSGGKCANRLHRVDLEKSADLRRVRAGDRYLDFRRSGKAEARKCKSR